MLDNSESILGPFKKNHTFISAPPTPVTIMVVDTIPSVKSRKLLRVLLDSGSTTTLINKKCLPKHCKPCQISSSRKVKSETFKYDVNRRKIQHMNY